jgi:hypothetical protein
MRRNIFTRLSSLNLRDALDIAPEQSESHEFGRIVRAWPEAAPSPLSGHCRPVLYRAERLTVQADSPVWANRLRHQSLGIMHELRQLAKVPIGEIRVSVGRTPAPPRPLPPAPTRPGPDVGGLVESGAEGLEDERLREAVRRLGRTLGRG